MPPIPTIGELGSGSVDWFWLWCAGGDCGHHAPLRLADAIARWGADASSNVIRRKAVCSKCGHRGATLQHPSWTNAITGYEKYPGALGPEAEAAQAGFLAIPTGARLAGIDVYRHLMV